jgi:hypothetical protein
MGQLARQRRREEIDIVRLPVEILEVCIVGRKHPGFLRVERAGKLLDGGNETAAVLDTFGDHQRREPLGAIEIHAFVIDAVSSPGEFQKQIVRQWRNGIGGKLLRAGNRGTKRGLLAEFIPRGPVGYFRAEREKIFGKHRGNFINAGGIHISRESVRGNADQDEHGSRRQLNERHD